MFLSNLSRLSFLSTLLLLFFIPPKGAWAAATFSLSPAASSQVVGATFNVDIVLDTGGEAVSGATALINYDTTRLSVVGGQLTQGTIFNQSPLTNTVDATTGRIQYDSGSLGTTYTGRGTMATIRFSAIAAGTAAVNYVFDATSTTNSSLVAAASSPTNILTTVNNGVYTITAAGTTPAPLPPTYNSGLWENTLLFLGAGGMLATLGWLLSKKAFAS